MGHRANFVVIKDGAITVFEDQWAALACTYDFAAGLKDATDVLKSYTETNGLMDWGFAEGGYLIDYDSKVAIVFGVPDGMDEGFEGMSEAPQEEPAVAKLFEGDYLGFLEGVASGWMDWEIIWDDRGVDAFALHLNTKRIDCIELAEPSHPPNTHPPFRHQA